MPGVRMFQQCHQFGSSGLAELRHRPRFPACRGDSIEPPTIATAGEIQMFLDFRRQTRRMFNHFTIHVQHLQTAVRSVCELHRTKPDVFRRNQFATFVHAIGCPDHPVGRQSFTMHDVAAHVADNGQPFGVIGPCVAAIDRNSGCPCKVSCRTTAAFNDSLRKPRGSQSSSYDAPRFDRADAEHRRLTSIDSNADARWCGRWQR